MDARITWDATAASGDLSLDGALLAQDDGLQTAVLISLFTAARAAADDPLPDPVAGRGGWWGDALTDIEGDQTGSRLWLLTRAKATADVLVRAREYAAAALAWLVTDGIATTVDVLAEWTAPGVLGLQIAITRTTGTTLAMRFDRLWAGSV